MRVCLVLVVITVGLAAGGACAQDDDGWNDILGIMNGVTAANQQLAGTALGWNPTGPYGGASGSQYVDAVAQWARFYAQLLGSVDGAFGVDGAVPGRATWDPFSAQGADLFMQQLQRLQNAPLDVMQSYQTRRLYRPVR